MSPTATSKPEPATKTFRFISKGAHFCLQHIAPQSVIENGVVKVLEKGHTLDFGSPFRTTGEHLPKGTFETTDPELAAWMREQTSFGTEFWEAGNEPDAIHPSIAELAPLIAKATSELDAGELETLLAEERGTHNRIDVVTMLEASLAQISSLGEAAGD